MLQELRWWLGLGLRTFGEFDSRPCGVCVGRSGNRSIGCTCCGMQWVQGRGGGQNMRAAKSCIEYFQTPLFAYNTHEQSNQKNNQKSKANQFPS